MTTTDRTAEPDAAFHARADAIEQAPAAEESWEATVDRVAQAIYKCEGGRRWNRVLPDIAYEYRRLARAAVAALQPGGER